MKKVLILGGSGFIGGALYRELVGYMDTFGTYHTQTTKHDKNQKFFWYDHETEDITMLLNNLRPDLIVSAVRGNFNAQVDMHARICNWLRNPGHAGGTGKQSLYAFAKAETEKSKLYLPKLLFLSSANVFDAFSNYPSFEYDKTLSESVYGRLKIRIENMVMRLPLDQFCIARVPMIFGVGSPQVKELRLAMEHDAHVEIFPNVVLNCTSIQILVQQLHYIINQDIQGVVHLGSTDLVHHDDLILAICKGYTEKHVQYTNVFSSNDDRYLAVLPRDNKLPAHLLYSYDDVVTDSISPVI